MLTNILKAIFGSKSARDVKRMMPLVNRINKLEEEYQTLTDEQLCEIIRDNPAGQDDQCTPFILIRKKQ